MKNFLLFVIAFLFAFILFKGGLIDHLADIFADLGGFIVAGGVIFLVFGLLVFIFSGVGLTLLFVLGFAGIALFIPVFPLFLTLLFPFIFVAAVIVLGVKLLAS